MAARNLLERLDENRDEVLVFTSCSRTTWRSHYRLAAILLILYNPPGVGSRERATRTAHELKVPIVHRSRRALSSTEPWVEGDLGSYQ